LGESKKLSEYQRKGYAKRSVFKKQGPKNQKKKGKRGIALGAGAEVFLLQGPEKKQKGNLIKKKILGYCLRTLTAEEDRKKQRKRGLSLEELVENIEDEDENKKKTGNFSGGGKRGMLEPFEGRLRTKKQENSGESLFLVFLTKVTF